MKKLLLVSLILASSTLHAATLKQGTFMCEQYGTYDKVRLFVKQHPAKANKAILNWEGRDRIVHWEPTKSGALRYEGAVSGILYIQTPHHSVLLDDFNKRVILSECVLNG